MSFRYLLATAGIRRQPFGWTVGIGGFEVGFAWTFGGDGTSSRSIAQLASYHPLWSVTWRWTLNWIRPRARPSFPQFSWRLSWNRESGTIFLWLWPLGGFDLSWQPTLRRSSP